jgi:hypothetical protein
MDISEMIYEVEKHPTSVLHKVEGRVPGYEMSSGRGYIEITLKAGDLKTLFPGFNWREYISEADAVAFAQPDFAFYPDWNPDTHMDALTMLCLCRDSEKRVTR